MIGEDIKAVFALLKELIDLLEGEVTISEEEISAILEMKLNQKSNILLIAVDSNKPVGMISGVVYQTLLYAQKSALINELIITRDRRGEGIGLALICAMRDTAKGLGCVELEVGTESRNLKAQEFYEKSGFDHSFRLYGCDL